MSMFIFLGSITRDKRVHPLPKEPKLSLATYSHLLSAFWTLYSSRGDSNQPSYGTLSAKEKVLRIVPQLHQ